MAYISSPDAGSPSALGVELLATSTAADDIRWPEDEAEEPVVIRTATTYDCASDAPSSEDQLDAPSYSPAPYPDEDVKTQVVQATPAPSRKRPLPSIEEKVDPYVKLGIKLLRQLDKKEARRERHLKGKITVLQGRAVCEATIAAWFRGVVKTFTNSIWVGAYEDICSQFHDVASRKISECMAIVGLDPSRAMESSAGAYVYVHADLHVRALMEDFQDAVMKAMPSWHVPDVVWRSPLGPRNQARVITVQEGTFPEPSRTLAPRTAILAPSQSNLAPSQGNLAPSSSNLAPSVGKGPTSDSVEVKSLDVHQLSSQDHWCVDSGANRDICKDASMSRGKAVAKPLVIGEAGKGHSFLSESEGPISYPLRGGCAPLFSRTIFAEKIGENIMSVSEAVDNGYLMVLKKDGVALYNAAEVNVKGAPVLTGGRGKNRLFYLDFPALPKCNVAVAGGPKGPSPSIITSLSSGAVNYADIRAKRHKGPTVDLSAPVNVESVFPIVAQLTKTYHEYSNEYDLWHSRMIHLNPKFVAMANPDLKQCPTKAECDDCIMGKMHKHPHSGSRPKPESLKIAAGEYLTCDLFGPVLRSVGGAHYAAFYSDPKSRFVYVKTLVYKTGHYAAFREVLQDMRARSGRRLRFFKSDGDGIFVGEESKAIYADYAIRHLQSAPGDSASNDIAERTIRTLVELTRTNLIHAGAPQNLWAEAMSMVVYVWNNLALCPSYTSPGKVVSRLNLLEGHERKFDISILRAFGTKCFFMLTVEKKGGKKMALAPKARLGAIVGIEDNMSAYRVFDFEHRGKIRRIPFAQIVTHEGHYPFRDVSQWSTEEKELPVSFVPSMEARCDDAEWRRYGFTPAQVEELNYDAVGGLPPTPTHAPDGLFPVDGGQKDPYPIADPPLGGEDGPPPLEEVDVDDIVDVTPAADAKADPGAILSSAVPPRGPSEGPKASSKAPSKSVPSSDRVLRERISKAQPLPQAAGSKTRRGAPKGSNGSSKVPQNGVPSSADHVGSSGEPFPTPGEPFLNLAPASGNLAPMAGNLAPTQGKDASSEGKVSQRLANDAPAPTRAQDIWRRGLSQVARVFDSLEVSLPVILLYRSSAGPLPVGEHHSAKVIPTDPGTKPISIAPPKNRKEALASPWWEGYHAAEKAEMESHAKNGTWVLTPRSQVPQGAPILRDRWAYDDKLAAGGKSIERFKARLTAMGCFQKEGVDYTDTYASVMSTRTFRTLLQLYNSDPSHRMDHWDVSTAFIHAPLKEQVWMRQASGHEVKGKESWVYLLIKALYGTKQAAHAWQQHLKKQLHEVGLTPLIVDPATYQLHEGKAFILIGTHVDDLFVVYNQLGAVLRDRVWGFLSKRLAIKDLGEARWTLQMSIQRDATRGVLKISQENFIVEVLRRFNMSNCNAAPTPAVDSGAESTITEADLPTTELEVAEVKALPFQELIGCLWWLAQMTRLDIFLALQKASHWVSKPSTN